MDSDHFCPRYRINAADPSCPVTVNGRLTTANLTGSRTATLTFQDRSCGFSEIEYGPMKGLGVGEPGGGSDDFRTGYLVGGQRYDCLTAAIRGAHRGKAGRGSPILPPHFFGLYRLVTWNAILLQGNTCLTAAVLLTLDSRFPEERYIWA